MSNLGQHNSAEAGGVHQCKLSYGVVDERPGTDLCSVAAEQHCEGRKSHVLLRSSMCIFETSGWALPRTNGYY